MNFRFSTKARTLMSLRGRIVCAQIAPLIVFSVTEWGRNRDGCLRAVANDMEVVSRYAVRSSCLREDGLTSSNAGAFLSVLDVSPVDLPHAIDEVIGSYGQTEAQDEILIQPMLTGIVRSGVAFSHDPNTGAPYRIINWIEGEDTTAVTSGAGGRIWQQAADSPLSVPQRHRAVVNLLTELLTLTNQSPVDCEFAYTLGAPNGEETLWLMQARPLILAVPAQSAAEQARRLSQIRDRVERGMKQHPFLIGEKTVYGVMPDWNPAEIIGIRPKPLALSLYRELVTDAIWAYQRNNYGYRNLRSFPLMPHLFGLPYIDVRVSFNSFIPADLDNELAAKLVNYYVNRLLDQPMLHDKVEFEIVFSCYTLDLPQRLDVLRQCGMTDMDITTLGESLRRLTNRISHPEGGIWRDDAQKIKKLNARYDLLMQSSADPLERIYWLLEDCKRYGTLPFAGLARAAFIAVQMLNSLVNVGVLSSQDHDAFLASLSTISGQLGRDRAEMNRTDFLKHYGHLRPGTYDIASPRYDEKPDLYFDWTVTPPKSPTAPPFALALAQMRDIGQRLKSHDLDFDAVSLFDFIQSAIELRESAKFHFTRNLSTALSLMTTLGQEMNFSADDLAYCDVAAFQEAHIGATDARELIARSIDDGRKRYQETLRLSLPPLIVNPDDVWAFEWPETAPNFITHKVVSAPVTNDLSRDNLAGRIVCIPNADPGYDWLLSYPIAGLITAWGGANSHMAIRAGELGLPSVIGAGEVLYRRWSMASKLYVNCGAKLVEVIAT